MQNILASYLEKMFLLFVETSSIEKEMNQSARWFAMTMKKEDNYPKSELDFKYRWRCLGCEFTSCIMYKADTHQCETDHCMERLKIKSVW